RSLPGGRGARRATRRRHRPRPRCRRHPRRPRGPARADPGQPMTAGTATGVLNVAGAFVFGVSGGLAAIRARRHLFVVTALAVVAALAGRVLRDLLPGVRPATLQDWRYLAVSTATGLLCFVARPILNRARVSVEVVDALGLCLFSVTGASIALAAGVGP